MAGMRHISSQFGFSLVELLVVVLILAVIAGATITAFNPDFVDDQELTATQFEMTQLRDAVLSFKRDNPTHALTDANLCSPADASFLITNGYDTDNVCSTTEAVIGAWDIDTRLGWQGPYITKLGNPTATSNVDIEHDGTIDVEAALNNVSVILDPYNNPYYFFELDNSDNARIVSFGPNGTYENAVAGCPAIVNGDDIIVCLR